MNVDVDFFFGEAMMTKCDGVPAGLVIHAMHDTNPRCMAVLVTGYPSLESAPTVFICLLYTSDAADE